jgi:zinc and cadmium transporter
MIITGISLFLIAIVGGLIIDILGNKAVNHLSLILAFGGAYIIGLLFLHLVPEAFGYNGKIAGLFVLIGFLVQILLEYISKGLEHGHAHNAGQCGHHHHTSVFPWVAFGSLCVHALLESMPLAEGAAHSTDHVLTMGPRIVEHSHLHIYNAKAMSSGLFVGLALHKLPVAMVLMGLISTTKSSGFVKWGMISVFGLMPLLGMLIYDGIIHSSIVIPGGNTAFIAATHGLVIGILLHISTTILFESEEGHTFNIKKLSATLLGLIVAYITLT